MSLHLIDRVRRDVASLRSRYAVFVMKRLFLSLALLVASPIALYAAPAAQDLRIYAVDVEGGQATLFVSPAGQSLLVDTGWDGFDGRDAQRIVDAAHAAGLQRIDTVLLTHYHLDHAGGAVQLAQKIPVGMFLDHGTYFQQDTETREPYKAYQALLASGKYKHVSVKVGEKLPIAGFDALAVSSDGAVITKPIAGAGQANALCATAPKPKLDTTENGHSLGVLIRFAGSTILDLGDLTSDREYSLVCPANRLGKMDVLIVSHHGTDFSNSQVFVHSIAPRVAVMDNGDHKGGSTIVIDAVKSSPGLQALYQLHNAPPAGSPNPNGSVQGGPEHNASAQFIANTPGVDGKRVDVIVHANGTVDVLNGRTGEVKHFARR